MSAGQKAGVIGNLERMQAQRIIFEGRQSRDPNKAYDLALIATGSIEKAEDTMRAAYLAEHDRIIERYGRG